MLEICHQLDLTDVVFVGHSVSAMIGVLAAAAEPERFGRLVLVGPSPRYIDDEDYAGGFTREDIEGLLESMDSNYLGWSNAMADGLDRVLRAAATHRDDTAARLTAAVVRTLHDPGHVDDVCVLAARVS